MPDEKRGGLNGKRNSEPTVPKLVRLVPDVLTAMNEAAAKQGVSTSRFVNDTMRRNKSVRDELTKLKKD